MVQFTIFLRNLSDAIEEVVQFNTFFENLSTVKSFLGVLGKNFTNIAYYCQKIAVLEYPVCFKNVFIALDRNNSHHYRRKDNFSFW